MKSLASKDVYPKHDALLRLPQVLEIIPVSAAHWWAKVKSHEFPQPVKLSARVTCWKLSEVLALIDRED